MAIATRLRVLGHTRRGLLGPAGATAWAALVLLLLVPSHSAAKVTSTPEGIRFSYVNANAQSVFLAGDFNGWSATAQPMQREGDTFSAVVPLAAGDHEYKFVVDGQYFADPDNPVTTGAFGNSLVRVDAKGGILAMEATSNTSLSPKILLDGRVIGLFIGRRDPTNGDRFGVSRPDFNIDLDWKIRMSEVLDARVLTKVRNASEGTPLWETSLRLDRGYLELHRSTWALRFSDNDALGTWEDPLRLVGDIGLYGREYGFERQGLRATGSRWGVNATALYTDNFRSGEPLAPPVDTLAVSTPGVRYETNRTDTNKNTLALRLAREVRAGITAGASMRSDRGYRPGTLSAVRAVSESLRVRETYGRTYENWTGGGLDLHWGAETGTRLYGEWMYGEAEVEPGQGLRQTYALGTDGFLRVEEELVEGSSIPVDVSQRWIFGGSLQSAAGFSVHGSLEWERHGLTSIATDSLRAFRNCALVYRAGAEVAPLERVRAGLDLEVYDFDYTPGAPWNTQLWFADRNFWMELEQHELQVGRYVQLGGENATTWSPWLECILWQGPPLVFRWEGFVRGSRIDRSPLSIESFFKFTYPVTKRLQLYSDTRWVRYDAPVLALDAGYVSTFAEVSYSFTPDISVAVGYGVDPYILDEVTNEYDWIGRNEFLIDQGATPTVARDRYLNLGGLLPRAEQALEDERRLQFEAIVKF